jgi:uncharacterized protein
VSGFETTRPGLPQILECLRGRQTAARDRYGVEFVGVVGSMARGEAMDGSDVDVVMNIVGHTTYFRLSEPEAELELEFGRPVDLMNVKPRLRATFERELVRA